MELMWWHWLIVGLVLVGLELVVPSFTIIWFGLGAILVGILMALAPDLSLSSQILTWTVVSVLLTLAWFRFFNPRRDRTFSGSAKGAVVGEKGLVIRAADSYGRGRVKFQLPLLGADEWPCVADEPLEVGDRVTVVEVEGHLLKVAKNGKGANR